MLEYIINETNKFLEQMPKSKRKKKGQFFTSKETAEFMATMFQLEELPLEINILDLGVIDGNGLVAEGLHAQGSISDSDQDTYQAKGNAAQ